MKTKLFLWLRVITGGGEEDQLTPDLLFHLVLTLARREERIMYSTSSRDPRFLLPSIGSHDSLTEGKDEGSGKSGQV